MLSKTKLSAEFYECFIRRNIWFTLSLYDIKARYRRTLLGPLWLTLGTAITILGMGLVWSSIFKASIYNVFPYISAGIIIWIFISSIVIDSCSAFTSQYSTIHNIKTSYFVYIMTMLMKNLIIMFHNVWVIVAVFLICKQPINFETFWAIPGFILLTLNGFWVAIILGIFATRYRDLSVIIANVMTLIMFLTPIMWKSEMLEGNRKLLAQLNPLAHLISIVRDPLLGHAPSLESYIVVIGIFFMGTLSALLLYKKYVNRIVFWM